jgi:hypothetical protein
MLDTTSPAWTILHDGLVRLEVTPGAPFAAAFAWCESYMEAELQDTGEAGARRALRAYRARKHH